ncbi:MAG: sn-glycerol-1-phosphate dehydrogenase [Lachnospiraceae bacterium]|nr:sn-glycerol-1-phosphate dehydrogenase [Lachnospiraceae bacterium]
MKDFVEIKDLVGDIHKAHSFPCPVCEHEHASTIGEALIGNGALAGLPGMLEGLKLGKKVLVVTDEIVYGLVGERAKELWESGGLELSWHVFKTPMLPNEQAIGEVFVEAASAPDVFVSLGGGSVCDVTRYVAHRLDIPLIPVPTAITHDGFFTDMSLLLLGGMKTTVVCAPPAAFLADIDIICKAPVRMNAAGLGEMASKFTALADWYAASLVNGDWYCDAVFNLMIEAIDQAFAASEGIASGDPDALLSLTDALYKSAVDMSWYGSARTGAGAEHHLTHYWVMRHAVRGEKPNMHGAEVGVGAVLVLNMWQRMLAIDENHFDIDKALDAMLTKEQWEEHVKKGYGDAAPEAFKAQKNKSFSREERRKEIERILKALPALREKFAYLPNYKEFAVRLKEAGAPYVPSQLHVTREEIIDSVLYAKEVRSKYTSLWIADALGLLPELSVALADDAEALEKELAD